MGHLILKKINSLEIEKKSSGRSRVYSPSDHGLGHILGREHVHVGIEPTRLDHWRTLLYPLISDIKKNFPVHRFIAGVEAILFRASLLRESYPDRTVEKEPAAVELHHDHVGFVGAHRLAAEEK